MIAIQPKVKKPDILITIDQVRLARGHAFVQALRRGGKHRDHKAYNRRTGKRVEN